MLKINFVNFEEEIVKDLKDLRKKYEIEMCDQRKGYEKEIGGLKKMLEEYNVIIEVLEKEKMDFVENVGEMMIFMIGL